MSFPRYPKYKDSEVDWLGEVPDEWSSLRARFAFNLITDRAEEASGYSVALENIESWSARFIETKTEFAGEGVRFRRGDLLFGKLRPYLAKILVSERDGDAVGDFHVLRPTSKTFAGFLKYLFLTPAFISLLDGSTIGAKMPRVSWPFLADVWLPVPSREAQRQIAAFLDQEMAKIDALIEQQRLLIELLKEKRQAFISHAVTKGLNRYVKMKASGIDWAGAVPDHWTVTRLSHYATVENGSTPSRERVDYWTEAGIPWLASGEVNQLRIESASEFITESGFAASSLRLLPTGTVIVGMVGQGKREGWLRSYQSRPA